MEFLEKGSQYLYVQGSMVVEVTLLDIIVHPHNPIVEYLLRVDTIFDPGKFPHTVKIGDTFKVRWLKGNHSQPTWKLIPRVS